jgi:dGTPase
MMPMTQGLAEFAVREEASRGREYDEPLPRWRSQFQRDRDRVIHSSAFRRLEYKTQVFVNHEGDMFRTRLTHSLEVAQIARSTARALRLNEDLTEAIALAHDLGHTPFGHAGQHALNACMHEFGGFEHNLHSLRVVDELEQRYPAFPGLNLMFETREGILKHCSVDNARELGELGRRFVEKRQPSLEAQLANVADEIAYNHHDIDDGLRAMLLTQEQLRELDLFRETEAAVRKRWPGADKKRLRYTIIREMLNHYVVDLIENTNALIDRYAPRSVDDVRAAPVSLVDFSPGMRTQHLALKRLLRTALYEHAHVREMAAQSEAIVAELFEALMVSDALWPESREALPTGRLLRAKAVADHLAGMTDRYAMAEYAKLERGRART